jgi:mannose-6-phosphate isomerase-like protein (cupin superfamily)
VAQLDVMEPSTLAGEYLAPTCSAKGAVASALFHPGDYSLWQVSAELQAGAELTWDGAQGDEALFVVEGAVSADGRQCGPDGTVVVEAGASGTVRAITDTKLLHVGSTTRPSASDGSAVPGMHVVDADSGRHVRYEGHPIENIYYADSTCPTCSIVLFSVSCDQPHVAASHVHSEDEIIHVLDGELQVGPQTVRAGMSVAIPAGRRYGFRTPGAYKFLNYRKDASTFTGAPGSDPVVEIPVA